MTADADIEEFLRRVDRLVEPALLLTPAIDRERLSRVMAAVYTDRHVFTLRADGPVAPTAAEVDETVRNSFDGRGVLAVLLGPEAPSAVTRAVGRLCVDEAFAEHQDGGWQHTRPPEGWRLVVVAQAETTEAVPGGLGAHFTAIQAL